MLSCQGWFAKAYMRIYKYGAAYVRVSGRRNTLDQDWGVHGLLIFLPWDMMLHSMRGGSSFPGHNSTAFVQVSHDVKNHGSTTKPPPPTSTYFLKKAVSIRAIDIQLIAHIPV
jgi:hypothetical protein